MPRVDDFMSETEDIEHQAAARRGLIRRYYVTGVGNEPKLGSRYTAGDHTSVFGRNETVGIAMDHERGYADRGKPAVRTPAQDAAELVPECLEATSAGGLHAQVFVNALVGRGFRVQQGKKCGFACRGTEARHHRPGPFGHNADE